MRIKRKELAKKVYRQAVSPTSLPIETLGDVRFRRLIPKKAWNHLTPAIRKRFIKRLTNGQSAVYQGHIVETRMNFVGRVLAHFLRCFGGPLPFERAECGTAAIVTVTEAPGGKGQCWTRQYNRKHHFPQVIHSFKSFTGKTGLEECIGYGIGMTLRVEADKTRLRFVSQNYFFTLLNRRIYLPTFLCPGNLVVGHHDLGGAVFDFTLDLNHPVFGELIHQRATFHDMEPTQ